MTTPSQNERAARILGWTAIKPDQFASSGLIGMHPEWGVEFTPNFTGNTTAFIQLIAHANNHGWLAQIEQTVAADESKRWATTFTPRHDGGVPVTDVCEFGATLQESVCAAFLAAFEPESQAA